MKLKLSTISDERTLTSVCFVNIWENPTISEFKYAFFASLHPLADDDYEFFTNGVQEIDIVKIEQLTPAKSKIDKALAHQLKYILGEKFIEYKPKTNKT